MNWLISSVFSNQNGLTISGYLSFVRNELLMYGRTVLIQIVVNPCCKFVYKSDRFFSVKTCPFMHKSVLIECHLHLCI